MSNPSNSVNPFDLPILLLDGGLGTTLEDHHSTTFSSTSTPLWSSHLLISSPSILLAAQSAFAAAGADVILTATYQASFEGFARTPRVDGSGQVGYGREEAERCMRSAVRIARRAFEEGARVGRTGRGIVALSLGAYGAVMVPSQEYTGDYSPASRASLEGLFDFHLERIECFTSDKKTWGGIDMVAFETLPKVDEVRACRMVMGRLQEMGKGGKRYWVSCVFPAEGLELPDGSSVKAVLEAMMGKRDISPVPYAIGVNCTKLHKLRALISAFEDAAAELQLTLPRLVIYPDGAEGLVYNTATGQWQNVQDDSVGPEQAWEEEVCDIVKEIKNRGAWKGIIVGGCCKTGPAHIKRLEERINLLQTG